MEKSEPDVLAGSHIRFGVLVMHEDKREEIYQSREDNYTQQEETHVG